VLLVIILYRTPCLRIKTGTSIFADVIKDQMLEHNYH